MNKLQLMEEIIKNSQSYRLRFITYERTDEGIRVRNNNGYFNEADIAAAAETIGLSTLVDARHNAVELLIYAS